MGMVGRKEVGEKRYSEVLQRRCVVMEQRLLIRLAWGLSGLQGVLKPVGWEKRVGLQ